MNYFLEKIVVKGVLKFEYQLDRRKALLSANVDNEQADVSIDPDLLTQAADVGVCLFAKADEVDGDGLDNVFGVRVQPETMVAV